MCINVCFCQPTTAQVLASKQPCRLLMSLPLTCLFSGPWCSSASMKHSVYRDGFPFLPSYFRWYPAAAFFVSMTLTTGRGWNLHHAKADPSGRSLGTILGFGPWVLEPVFEFLHNLDYPSSQQFCRFESPFLSSFPQNHWPSDTNLVRPNIDPPETGGQTLRPVSGPMRFKIYTHDIYHII